MAQIEIQDKVWICIPIPGVTFSSGYTEEGFKEMRGIWAEEDGGFEVIGRWCEWGRWLFTGEKLMVGQTHDEEIFFYYHKDLLR